MYLFIVCRIIPINARWLSATRCPFPIPHSQFIMSPRFREALVYAAELHDTQTRKASNIPYVAHLLAVTAIALEHGANEDEAIAALLHDAVEDQGGQTTAAEIRRRFGVAFQPSNRRVNVTQIRVVSRKN